MSKQPIELMFGAYRRRLLAMLLLRPGEKFHVRALGRMSGISVGSIHRELKAMADAGLLLREHAGNQVLYQANPACPIFEELAAIFRKTIGLAGLLHDALSELQSSIEAAFVFGSMAAGQQNASSDLDVLVLADLKLIEVIKALSLVQADIGREINPVVMTANEFIRQVAKKERFAMRVLDEPKIFFIGHEDEFAKLIKDRVAG